MSKLSERQLLILTISVSVLITGGLVALILNDRGKIDSIQDEITTIEGRIRAADVEIRKTKDREERVMVFRAVESRELAILPSKQKIADFHRGLSQFIAASGMRFREAPSGEASESELAKGIFVTRSNLQLRGDANSVLTFVNMVENDPRLVAVKGFEVEAGKPDEDDPEERVLHDVDITLATYFYNPAAAGFERVHIPGEARRLEQPSLRSRIESFEPERPDTYMLRPAAARRDAFVDPRRERVIEDHGVSEKQYLEEEAIVVDVETRLREINEKVEQVQALLQSGRVFEADRLQEEIDRLTDELRAQITHVRQMKKVVIPPLQARFEAAGSELERAMSLRPERDVAVTRAIAEKTYEELLGLFQEGKFAELSSQGSAWATYVSGKHVEPEARRVVSEIKELRGRAKTLAEFQAMKLEVTGVMLDGNDPSRNYAVINRQGFRPGDRYDERGELIVGRISRDAVTFTYKGETIRLPVRRPSSEARPTGAKGILQPVGR